MAVEVHTFPVTVPAGTPSTAPLTFSLAMPPRVVQEVHVQVPPGPRGEVGWALGAAGSQVYPIEDNVFIVTDNETVKWPLEQAITSGAWQLIAYNTGQFNHTLYVRFLVNLNTPPDASPSAPIDALALSNS